MHLTHNSRLHPNFSLNWLLEFRFRFLRVFSYSCGMQPLIATLFSQYNLFKRSMSSTNCISYRPSALSQKQSKIGEEKAVNQRLMSVFVMMNTINETYNTHFSWDNIQSKCDVGISSVLHFLFSTPKD